MVEPASASPPPHASLRDVELAVRELARLQEETVQTLATLTRLREDVSEAESALGRHGTARLLEANEQLVLSALRSQTDAEITSNALTEMSRTVGFDPLTTLPNRGVLLDRFAQASATAQRHGVRMAMLFLDLDGIKQINDSFGHAAGDHVLQLAALRLEATVRQADTVSRHGGDEFLVLLTEVAQTADAGLIAEKMLAALGASTRIGSQVLRLSASIGISIFPDDGDSAQTLIARADAAMYRAKKEGPGGYAFAGEEPGRERGQRMPPTAFLQRPITVNGTASAEHESQHSRHSQLREANEQLVLAVMSAQDLQAAAERANRLQRESLAFVAHELRNPLTPIRTVGALLGRVAPDEMPRMQAIIERQVAHMTRLVDDLLDLSRVNVGKLRLEHQMVELATIIEQVVDGCRPAMVLRLQRFSFHRPAGPLLVDGDPVRLAQIFSNLLDNASKYTPNGGEISIVADKAAGRIVITVSDTGIGIAPASLLEVFKPFVQDAQAIGFNGIGLGIGLTVVRELVEAHGGSVVAHSGGSGLGSQFVVTLPLAA